MSKWPMVPIGKVLTKSEDWVALEPERQYNEVTIRLWGKGVVLRRQVIGAEIASSRRLRVRANQFILSRIDARNGAIGLVPESLDGAVVSTDFPTFALNAERVIPPYLGWMSQTPAFVEICKLASEGTTNRVRLQEDRFLKEEISLPPLSEQQRIVARIEALAAKIEEARSLRIQAAQEAEMLMASEERKVWPDSALSKARTLESVTVYLGRGRQSEQGESDHFLIKTQHVQQGRYVPSMMRLAAHIAQKVQPDAFVQPGDILIACSAAGCLGRVARFRDEGRVASTDTHVAIARANAALVDGDYLYFYLRGAQGQHQLRSRERGDWQREKISFRLTELNLNDLRQVPVPIPPQPEQRRIVAYLDGLQAKVDALKKLQAETAAELAALLPSILDKAFKGEL
jgi:type I restriction enzyme, S subunit